MGKKSKKPLYIFISVLIFLTITFIMYYAVVPGKLIPGSLWQIQSNTESGAIKLPYVKEVKSPETIIYTSTFPKPEIEDPALIIIRPLSYALEVYLNGDLQWKIAEITRPTGNIWNYSFTIPLSGSLENMNTLVIKSSALHITGFPSPPFIEEYSKSVSRINLTNFIFNDFLMFSIGASFILGLLLLLLSITRKTAPDAAFYMGIAAVTAAVYCLDYQYRISGGSPEIFMLQKKLFLVCGYISAGSFLFAVSIYSDSGIKFRKPVFILTTTTCAGILTAWNFPVLYTVFKFTNIILIINLLIGIFMLIKMVKTKESFLIPMCLLLLSICQVVVDTGLSIAGPLSLQYIIIVSTIFFSIHILLDFNQIFRENRKLAIGIHKDPLTGVFNRRYLKKMHPSQWDRIVLTDIDNFKYYNDTYGHGRGDQILLIFVEIIQENLRTNDLLMRLGGDEFLIFLSNVDTRQAGKILKRIAQQFKARIDDQYIGFSYGIEIIDMDIEEAVAKADILMYEMKKSKKLCPQQTRG